MRSLCSKNRISPKIANTFTSNFHQYINVRMNLCARKLLLNRLHSCLYVGWNASGWVVRIRKNICTMRAEYSISAKCNKLCAPFMNMIHSPRIFRAIHQPKHSHYEFSLKLFDTHVLNGEIYLINRLQNVMRAKSIFHLFSCSTSLQS